MNKLFSNPPRKVYPQKSFPKHFNMKSFILSIFTLLLILFPYFIMADEGGRNAFTDKLFLEIWNDNSYRKTEFGTDEPDYAEEDYYISQLSLSAGIRLNVWEDVFFDTYIITDLAADWGDEEWNDVYWNNMMDYGFGARLSYDIEPQTDEDQVLRMSDFTVDLFADFLFSEDSPDNSKDNIPSEDASNNVRTGISVWTSLDSREFFSETMSLWSEIWGELAYESTGFASENADNYYLFTIDALIGLQFPFGDVSLQPYYSLEFMRDFGDEQWNKEPWLNNYTYGPGFRLSMGELLPIEDADLYLYAEYVQVDYLSRVDSELYENTFDDDTRIGVEIYLPFGAIKDRIERH